MKILIILFCVISNICNGCNLNDTTPIKYRNYSKVQPEIYGKHEKYLFGYIRSIIGKGIEPFNVKEYDSLTEVFIDTIIYSPSKNKLAFFVIAKNSNDKLLSGGNRNEFHYDAHCFIGHISLNDEIFDISWLSAYNLSRYENLESASYRIRELHFQEFNETRNPKAKYNLDDIRFWDSEVWNN